MAKISVCLECQQERPIIGRGLCGTCYNRLKKADLLDTKYPLASVPLEKPAEMIADPDTTTEEPLLPTVKPAKAHLPETPEEGDGTIVPLHFTARDTDLLAFLRGWATDERRSLDQQILAVLDNARAAAA